MRGSGKRLSAVREFKELQPSTRILLNRSEGADVEFKESASVLDASDFTAFANSQAGGVILIGVREIKKSGQPQRGEIIGCSVDEGERRKVHHKALNNWPPVSIVVTVENTSDKAIFRVDVPSGPAKPYATQAGAYVTRGDGHRLPLAPQALLNFLLELEGERFLGRFRQVTEQLEDFLEAMQRDLRISLDQIQGTVDSAEGQQNDAMGMLDDAHGLLTKILQWSEHPDGPDAHDVIDHLRVKAILDHLSIPDPALDRLRTHLRRQAREMIKEGFPKEPEVQDELLKRMVAIYGFEFVGNFSSVDFKKECDEALASVRAEVAAGELTRKPSTSSRSARRKRARKAR